ncbi:hypothetical protein DL769_003710 [Monosporascus sp. CRB-8-3]|nr:hypothetical protein DL769_003710 [Monosporascus sp. CRB-8-3]
MNDDVKERDDEPAPLQQPHGRIGEDAGRGSHSSHGQSEPQSALSKDGDKQDPAPNGFVAPIIVRDGATVQQPATSRPRAGATRARQSPSVAAQRKSSSSPTPSQISSLSSSDDLSSTYSAAYPVLWTISSQSKPTPSAPSAATNLAVPVHVHESESHGRHSRSISKGDVKPLSPHKRR